MTIKELQEHIEFIKQIIATTKSNKCRNDYKKALIRYQKELRNAQAKRI